MKYLFILNPGSRGGSSNKHFGKILNYMDRKSIHYDYKMTASLEDAYHYSLEGNRSGYDVIVAVGGDGTLNRVLNGFYDSRGKRVSGARMGVIYTGTSPDFCKSYGIPLDLDIALQTLLDDRTREIQIAKVTLAKEFCRDREGLPVTEDCRFITRYFACCANIGLGASLARNANSGIRKIFGDHAGTFMALLKTLALYQPCDFYVSKDGNAGKLENVYSISIGKTAFIASGMKVKSELMESDGRFYNLFVKDMKAGDLFRVLKQIYTGRICSNDGVISLDYCKRIEIYGNIKNPEVEFDGDPAGFLPCRIEMAEESLDLIVGGCYV